jgi:hypothetical protein
LEQEHEASILIDLIDIANTMATQAECDPLAAELNRGGMEEEEPESAEKIAEEYQKLEIKCAVVIEQQLKKMHE